MDTDKATAAYIKLRDKRAELKSKFEEEDKELKSKMEKIEAAMLAKIKQDGSEGFKTKSGTVSRVIKTRYWPADVEAFKDFVRENDALDLFETRIHQGNYKKFIEENPDLHPPVNADSAYSIRVQRSKK